MECLEQNKKTETGTWPQQHDSKNSTRKQTKEVFAEILVHNADFTTKDVSCTRPPKGLSP